MVSMKAMTSLAALALCAASLSAQVTTADSARRPTTMADSTRVTTLGANAMLARRDSAVTPVASQARGIDAEVRVALFELLADRAVPAIRRLQWLASSPIAFADSNAATGAYRGRRDLLFLLAEAQYRFGMDSAFLATAQPLLANGALPTQYASLLQSQMLLAAYRTGNYQRVVELAKTATDASSRGLASLVSGLASYQLRNYANARASFAAARQAAGPYALYAQYMDVLTGLRVDTTQSAAALGQLETVASAAPAEFADQVRLTAAQLAYERGMYDRAITLADAVSGNRGYAAPALLTKAWAQYKADRIADAGQSFAAFADRYPQLPERDEARLMAAQSLLQLGRTQDAGRVFAAVADSATGEARQLQSGAQTAMATAARALVSARAAGLLFVQDPASGKTVVLQDRAGADPALLAMAVSDTVPAMNVVPSTRLLSFDDVRARFDSVGDLGQNFPRRVLFSPASASGSRASFASNSQALYAADVAIAVARHDLEMQLAAHQMQIAMLRQLQAVLVQRRDSLTLVANQLNENQVALNRLLALLEEAHARIRGMLTQQATLMRDATSENTHILDSLSRTLGSNIASEDQQTLALERNTVEIYRRTAEMLLPRIDSAIRHHPAFALRDTVKMRNDSVRSFLTQAQTALASAENLVNGELARLQTEPEAITRLRGAVAEAEARRRSAETQLVAAVDAELRARSTEMLTDLARHTEAAEFGQASASFFQALDANGRASGAVGTTGATGSAAVTRSGAAVVSASSPSSKQK
jgi:hypothetical protein